MPQSRSTIRILIAVFAVFSTLWLGACQNNQQFGGYYEQSFAVTPKCGVNEKLLTFGNVFGEPLEILGIAFSSGTNGGGNFSIQGLRIGGQPEIAPNAAGGIDEVSVPPGGTYALRVRYSPLEESGDATQTAIIDFAYVSPNSGIVQVEVSGRSVGEADCPEQLEGNAAGLTGEVNLTINQLVAVTPPLLVPLSSDNGARPFDPVQLTASIDGTDFDFPQITAADAFLLPEPDPTDTALSQLFSLVDGDTMITSDAAVTGILDPETGTLEIPNLVVNLEDGSSLLQITLDLTTELVDPLSVDSGKLTNGGFTLIDGMVSGTRIQADGFIELVGATVISSTVGHGLLFDTGKGQDVVVRILATVLCPNGTTDCSASSP